MFSTLFWAYLAPSKQTSINKKRRESTFTKGFDFEHVENIYTNYNKDQQLALTTFPFAEL